jgi:tetratricopeptide (TPR) repeat protein
MVAALTYRGMAAASKGRFNEALTIFSNAIALSPEIQGPILLRGLVYADLKQPEKALTDFLRMLQIDTRPLTPYDNTQDIGYTLHESKEAITDFSRLLVPAPGSTVNYLDRGSAAYQKLKRYQQAMYDCDSVVKKYPANAPAYRIRAYSKDAAGYYEGAITDYDLSLKIDPKSALTYNYRGYTYLKMKKYQQALDDYNEAIKLGGKDFHPEFLYRETALKGLAKH